MTRYNTNNPVPSHDPRDLDDNAQIIDDFANSTFPTTINRFGATVKTLAGLAAESTTLRNDLAADDGSSRVGFITTGAGANGRTVQDTLRELSISVVNYMTDAERADAYSGTPVLDHAPAFARLITALGSIRGRAKNPGLAYRLDTNVIGTTAVVLEFDDDATFVGSGIFFGMQTVYNKPSDSRRSISGAPNAGTIQAVDEYVRLTNTATTPGYGHRQDYVHTGTLSSGFSLGKGNVCVWQSIINGASGMAEWVVATTPPLASGGSWGVVTHEHNIMNRGPDNGYKKTRGESTRWAGGIQLVPEADDLAGGTGNICRNALFAYCVAHSINLNDLGLQCKFYNGVLVEKDSIAPDGRGSLISGDTSAVPASLPYAGIEIDQRWATGIDTQAATFTGNNFAILGNGHKFTWTNTGNGIGSTAGNIFLNSATSQNVQINPGGDKAAVFAYNAGAVNFLNMFGGAGAAGPAIGAGGPGTDIDVQLQPKGAGVFDYRKAAVAATTPGNFTATHMIDFKFNGVAYKVPARVAAW